MFLDELVSSPSRAMSSCDAYKDSSVITSAEAREGRRAGEAKKLIEVSSTTRKLASLARRRRCVEGGGA